MHLTALFATAEAPTHPPKLDVAHEPIFIHGGAQPSSLTTLLLNEAPFQQSRAYAMGLQWLRLNRLDVDLCWLGDARDASIQPLLSLLDQDPRIGAIEADTGTLIRVDALKTADFVPTPPALRSNGWRWVRAPAPASARHPAASLMSPLIVRPFRRRDLAPIPPDWQVGPPDFIGAGCGKA
ncbi:MAG: hypothetical protein AAFV53_08950, partial [Myxococcota bacterium]